MLFNSIEFFVFLITVLLFLFIMPKKWRVIWLLAAGYFFFMSWNPVNIVFLLFTSISTYFASRYLERKSSKGIVALVTILNVLIIVIGKYTGLIPVPIGVSFYTLQALGYVYDVYRRKSEPEKNYLKYSLFVCFFPLIESGPIERSTRLLKQINGIETINLLDFERIKSGALLILWGFFQKLVIADRAALLVNKVYSDYTSYGAVEILMASVLFSIEIYCDFGGYSNMAIGVARIMGFDVMKNFKQPYLASNIKEFWRRWHISLTSWFTDYIYISLGGNRKGIVKKYIFIIIVFAVSGMWHGKAMNFIAWGLLHGFYQIVGDFKNRHIKKRAPKMVGTVITFCLVNFAWIFFAAPSFSGAVGIIRQIFVATKTSSIFELGLERGDFVVLIIALIILAIIDVMGAKGISVVGFLNNRICVLRWVLYTTVILVIIVFGIYGIQYDTSSFMYIQF